MKKLICTRPSCRGLKREANDWRLKLVTQNYINEALTAELEEQKEITKRGFEDYIRERTEIENMRKFHLEENGGFCGVYMLHYYGSIIYIGQSIDVFGRVSSHRIDKDFNSVTVFQVERKNLNVIESLLIRELEPPLNIMGKN